MPTFELRVCYDHHGTEPEATFTQVSKYPRGRTKTQVRCIGPACCWNELDIVKLLEQESFIGWAKDWQKLCSRPHRKNII